MFFRDPNVVFLRGVGGNDNAPRVIPSESWLDAGVRFDWQVLEFKPQVLQVPAAQLADALPAQDQESAGRHDTDTRGTAADAGPHPSGWRPLFDLSHLRELWFGALVLAAGIASSGHSRAMFSFASAQGADPDAADLLTGHGVPDAPHPEVLLSFDVAMLPLSPLAITASAAPVMAWSTPQNLVVTTAADTATPIATPLARSTQLHHGSEVQQPLPGPQAQATNEPSIAARPDTGVLVIGRDGTDVLIGGDGNDVLDGGGGADRMAGGLGDDVYVVDHAGDAVIETADGGEDTVILMPAFASARPVAHLQPALTAAAVPTFALPDHVENVVAITQGPLVIAGNASANILIGGFGQNAIAGGEGGDFIFADAETARDLAQEISRLPQAVGAISALQETAAEAPAPAAQAGPASSPTATPEVRDGPILDATRGQDVLEVLEVAAASLELILGANAAAGSNAFALQDVIDEAEAALDVLTKGSGNAEDRLLAASSTLSGGEGNDVIGGGRANDVLSGGLGHDVFVFLPGFGSDVIEDFGSTAGDFDMIFFAKEQFKDLDDLTERMTQLGDDVLIVARDESSLLIKGADKMELANNDHFIFL